MTTRIHTTTEELEVTRQLSSGVDSTIGYSVATDELFVSVVPTIQEIVEHTAHQPVRGVGEGEPSDGYVDHIQSVEEQETSSEASAPKEMRTAQYELKQKWEGYVLEVGQDTFRARLTSLAGEPGDHIANIYLAEVDKAERNLIKPGSIFYWSIGYRDSGAGRRRESFIRFQRLPRRSECELEAARRRGEELLQLFSSE